MSSPIAVKSSESVSKVVPKSKSKNREHSARAVCSIRKPKLARAPSTSYSHWKQGKVNGATRTGRCAISNENMSTTSG